VAAEQGIHVHAAVFVACIVLAVVVNPSLGLISLVSASHWRARWLASSGRGGRSRSKRRRLLRIRETDIQFTWTVSSSRSEWTLAWSDVEQVRVLSRQFVLVAAQPHLADIAIPRSAFAASPDALKAICDRVACS
jgi:hypothetical protein